MGYGLVRGGFGAVLALGEGDAVGVAVVVGTGDALGKRRGWQMRRLETATALELLMG